MDKLDKCLGMPWITWGSPIGNPVAPEVQELRALVQAATVLDVGMLIYGELDGRNWGSRTNLNMGLHNGF